MKNGLVDGLAVNVDGGICRTVALRDEGYAFVDDPDRFCHTLAASGLKADLLTFAQRCADPTPRFLYHQEWDSLAVLRIQNYEMWWKRQINDKTRNMVRKAEKKGVVFRQVVLDDALVRGIKMIYDESPVRQGRRFKHYGKDLATLHGDHATFLDCSDFVGAFHDDRLIGFIKLVHQGGWSSLMQIISLISLRDKAPTNGLIAKAVEICAQKDVPLLQYGVWSRRSMGDFKEHHGFERYNVPRYFVPLSVIGRMAIAMGMHRSLMSRVPEHWLDRAAEIRGRLNSIRFRPRRG